MGEPGMNEVQENTIIYKEDEINEEHTEKSADLERSSSNLGGINLVMILSYLSASSAQERGNLEENNLMGIDDLSRKTKESVSRSDSRTRRREVNEFRAAEKQIAKVHTKIRDCRHCRRL